MPAHESQLALSRIGTHPERVTRSQPQRVYQQGGSRYGSVMVCRARVRIGSVNPEGASGRSIRLPRPRNRNTGSKYHRRSIPAKMYSSVSRLPMAR